MFSLVALSGATKINQGSYEKLESQFDRRIKKTLAEVKIQRGIFQGDALSPLEFVKAIMQLIHILRKCTGDYKFTKLQNHLMYMDKLSAKMKKN